MQLTTSQFKSEEQNRSSGHIDSKVSASILSADFSRLGDALKQLELAGADMVHLDVMDGSFVPNITFGQEVVKSLRKCTSLPFDTHLMIRNPDRHIPDFAMAGSNIITVHAEACSHLDYTINLIKSLNVKAGVAIVPSTPESVLQYVIDKVDLVLVMSVNPGFGGQKFIDSSLVKIRNIRTMLHGASNDRALLSVDGGINEETAKLVKKEGCNTLVSGSFLLQDPLPSTPQLEVNIKKLKVA